MKLQPTASRSEVLVNCSWWVDRELPKEEIWEAAKYGIAFHEAMAAMLSGGTADIPAVAGKYDLSDHIADELTGNVHESFRTLQKWLSGVNPYKIDFSSWTKLVEQPIALYPNSISRKIPGPDEDHVYPDLELEEIAGTADLIVLPDKKGEPILVLDHKTGASEDYSRPWALPQLKTLGIAAARLTRPQTDKIIVAVLHAPRRGLPKVYAEDTTLWHLGAHERQLARSLDLVNTGYLRPGRWCDKCPGRSVCPAYGGQLTEAGASVLRGLVAAGNPTAAIISANDGQSNLPRERKLGLLLEVVQQAEKMATQARLQIKAEMKRDGIFPETSGGYVTLRTHERESVSKSSIMDAYGKLEGERVLAKLREDGAVKKTTVEQMTVEKERGS